MQETSLNYSVAELDQLMVKLHVSADFALKKTKLPTDYRRISHKITKIFSKELPIDS